MALPVIVVQESIADQFTALLKKKALDMKVGCAYDAKTDLGPVVSAEHKTKICNWIKKGVDEGAELVLDGRNVVVEGYEKGILCRSDDFRPCKAWYGYRREGNFWTGDTDQKG